MTVPDPYLPSGDGSGPQLWSAPHGQAEGFVPAGSQPAPAYPGLPPYVPPVANGVRTTAAPLTASPYPTYGGQSGYGAGYGPGVGGYGPGVGGYGPGVGGYGPGVGGYGATPPVRNGVAVAALITGLVSLVLGIPSSGGVLGVVGGLVGVGLGIGGLRKAKRGAPRKGMATWGLITSALAVVLGALLFVVIADDLGDAWSRGWERGVEQGSGSVDSDDPATDGALGDAQYEAGWDDGYDTGYADGSDSAETRPAPDAAVLGQPLALGGATTVGTYQVTVTDIQLDADAIIAAASTDNYPADGRYVQATLLVTNTGPTATRPVMELLASYWGADDVLYDEWACNAFTTRPSMEVGLVQPGGSAEYDVCIDVPVGAIGDVSVVVEDLRAATFSASQWNGA